MMVVLVSVAQTGKTALVHFCTVSCCIKWTRLLGHIVYIIHIYQARNIFLLVLFFSIFLSVCFCLFAYLFLQRPRFYGRFVLYVS